NGTMYYPWLLDPFNPASAAMRGVNDANAADHRNNVEQVLVNNPITGTWRMRVSGYNVPVAPQRFSLVSEVLSQPSLVSIAPAIAQPGSQVVLHGSQFAYPCTPSNISVSLG